MPLSNHRLSVERIEESRKHIDAVFLNTPQFVSEPLSRELGTRTLVKIETLNPVRSFKGRGAELFASGLNENERIVCASAGNFGQAIAYSCRSLGIPVTVFAALGANELKVSRMIALGATVIQSGKDFDDAKAAARHFAKENGLRMVEDGLDPAISEGAGSIGVELLGFSEPIERLLIPLGNGALLSGVARVFKARSPKTKIVAVQSSNASAMVESLRSGTTVIHDSIDTIADGIGVRVPIDEALIDIRGLVDEVVLVKESSIVDAMRLLHEHVGLVVEPSGAVGIAAMLDNSYRDQLVATVICGGNLTNTQIQEYLT